MSQKKPYDYENETSGYQTSNGANGFDPQDLENLARSVCNLGTVVTRQVSQQVSQKLDEAAARIEEQKEKRPAAQPRKKRQPVRSTQVVHVSSSDSLSSGVSCFLGTLSYCGAGVLGFFSVLALLGIMTQIPYMIAEDLLALVPLLFGVAGAAGLALLGKRLFNGPARKKRLERYLSAMGSEDAVPFTRLAEVLRQDQNFVKKDLSDMIRRGLLPNGYIDDEEGIFFLNAEKYRALQRRQEAQKHLGSGEASAMQDLLIQMEDFLYLLDEHIASVKDQKEMEARLEKLRLSAADILSWTRAHPAGIGQVRRLTSYYMPTTLKLLRTYADVKDQQGETADGIRKEITDALESLVQGFENLRTSLLTNVALDVSSEIGAVQTMLAQDGLANSIFDIKE